ncbi:hypothetical protein LZ31DRAFT_37299 [Colletotrichum somersetense]|nr:hypothetical protein LZ31DRAFT_37299 [Colletotrichum somersetense]
MVLKQSGNIHVEGYSLPHTHCRAAKRFNNIVRNYLGSNVTLGKCGSWSKQGVGAASSFIGQLGTYGYASAALRTVTMWRMRTRHWWHKNEPTTATLQLCLKSPCDRCGGVDSARHPSNIVILLVSKAR